MSDKPNFHVNSNDRGMVIAHGLIPIQSGGLPISSSITYSSASKVAVGTLRVTYQDSYIADKGVFLQLYNTGSQAFDLQVSGTSPQGKFTDFFLITGSSGKPADPSNNITVGFLAILQNMPGNG